MGDATTETPVAAYVMLDPAIEVLRRGDAASVILCHSDLEMGMFVPPGEGLDDLLGALKNGWTESSSIIGKYDDAALANTILGELFRQGFLLGADEEPNDRSAVVDAKRRARRLRGDAARPAVETDLDNRSRSELIAQLQSEHGRPIDLVVCCASLIDHSSAFAELAELHNRAALQLHSLIVHTQNFGSNDQVRRDLRRMGAQVVLRSEPELSVAGINSDLNALVMDLIPVHGFWTVDSSVFDQRTRRAWADWVKRNFLSGLILDAVPANLWPGIEPNTQDCIEFFEIIEEFSSEVGEIRMGNLPRDEVLQGRAQPRAEAWIDCPASERFRKAYLRWRLNRIKDLESGFTWSQSPEQETKFVQLGDDLLPNNPDLLNLRDGSDLLDVCGGLGRVARRLAPAVCPTGVVVSIEMNPCLVEKAREHVARADILNVQFRVGVAQRIPLPDASVDAAVNEWTGAIWELGQGDAMLAEMARVVRPGGRIAVTHRLVQMPLTRLSEPWVQYEDIYPWVRTAFERAHIPIVVERIWGQKVPSLIGENASCWREQHLIPVVDPFDYVYEVDSDPAPRADIFLTMIGEKPSAASAPRGGT